MEHFLDIIQLMEADAESTYSALIDCLKQKHLQVSRVVGTSFDAQLAHFRYTVLSKIRVELSQL